MRFTDHEKRKKQVLLAVIKNYTQMAEPIGSQLLCQDFDCSSATIRNILAELEEVGFLTHLYTSSGRIPTDKGYRFYIDSLTSENSLIEEQEKKYILKEYKKNDKEIRKIEDTLENASGLVSQITHQAGIVSFIDYQDKLIFNGMSFILEQPEFRNLEKTLKVIKILEEKKRLLEIINQNLEERLKIYVGHELCCPEIEDCSLIVSTYELNKKPYGRIAILGPRRMNYLHLVPMLEYISTMVSESLNQI